MIKNARKSICNICKNNYGKIEGVFFRNIDTGLSKLIKKDYPDLDENSFICNSDLNKYRKIYIETLIKKEKEYADLEEEVLNSIVEKEIITENPNVVYSKKKIFGQNVADSVAKFGGSWTFIIIFLFVLLLWIGVNSTFLIKKPFDPYPYILLNLVLSCIAALQAPVIMMSQNRQEDKDRVRAENDYQINLKAEIEIKILHEKLNHLITEQWDRLVEIQNIQIDLLENLQERINHFEKSSNKR